MSQIEVSQEHLKNLMDKQYKFHAFNQKLEHMSPQVKAEFAELTLAVQDLFKEHQEKEDKKYVDKSKMFDKIRDDNSFSSIWSIYKVDDINSIFGYVQEVEYLTCVEIVAKEVTWLELWAIAERLMKQSGDSHHVFIEGFAKKPNDISHHLITGS